MRACTDADKVERLPSGVTAIAVQFHYAPGTAPRSGRGCMLIYEHAEWRSEMHLPKVESIKLFPWRRTELHDIFGHKSVLLDGAEGRDQTSFRWTGLTALLATEAPVHASAEQEGNPVIFVDTEWCQDMQPKRCAGWRLRGDCAVLKLQAPTQRMRIPEPDGKFPYRMMVLVVTGYDDDQTVLVQHCTAWKFESDNMLPALQDQVDSTAHLLVIASARWMIYDQDGSFRKKEKGGAMPAKQLAVKPIVATS